MPTTEKPEIPRGAVDSSNIASYGYDPESKQLAVEFKSGAIFHYQNVDVGTVVAFDNAASKGSFFARNIKGKFTAERMTGVCPACNDTGWIGRRCVDCGTHDYVPQEPRGMRE